MKRSKQQRACSFCGTPRDQVQRLIAGPHVSVCDACVARFLTSPEAPQEERGLRCSFCGKSQRLAPLLAVGPGGVCICRECLALCQEIIVSHQPH